LKIYKIKFIKTVNPLILKGFLFFLMEFGCKYVLKRQNQEQS